jgi:hypothetical protein
MANVANLQIASTPHGYPVTTPSFNNQVFSASSTKLGVIFQAQSAEPITALLARYGVRTGTPPAHKISLQGVDISGNPDGTVKGGASPASKVFTPPASTAWDGTVQTFTLDNSYTPAAGDWLAWVLEYSSGTIDASNNSSWTRSVSNIGSGRYTVPYTLLNTGTWARTGTALAVWGWKGATNTFGFPLLAVNATSATVDGNRVAMRFTLPSGAGTSIGVAGLRLNLSTPAAGGQNYIVGIWDDAGTALQTITIDSDYISINGITILQGEAWFSSPATLTDGTVYYAGVQRSGTNLGITTLDFANANDLTAMPGGSGFYLATWNGSAWSAVQTSRPFVELMLSDMTASGGGGGLLTHPGMSGRLAG